MLFSRAGLRANFMIGRAAILEAICYPADVVLEFISYPMAFLGYFYFVLAMFSQGGDVGGYSISSLTTYFSVGWVLRMIFDQGLEGELGGEIQSGDVALSLVRPIPLQTYFFSRFAGLGLARLVYYALPAWALLFFAFGDQISLDPLRIVWFLPFALTAFRLAFEIQFLLGLLSFFITMNHQVSWTVDMLIRLSSGLIVPLQLFPQAVAAGLELLPFQYLYYKPISALLEPSSPQRLLADLAIGIAWTAFFYAVNRGVFSIAMKKHVIYGS